MKKSVLQQIRAERGGMTIEEVKERKEQRKLAKKIKRNQVSITAKTRATHMVRWAKISGVEPTIDDNGNKIWDYSKIDYTNPIVELEHWLDNFGYLVMKNKRERELKNLSKEQQELYWDKDLAKNYLPENLKDVEINSKQYYEAQISPGQIIKETWR